MAETLYRKYRPKSFGEVTDQEHIKLTIGQEIKSGQIAHAFLFTGPRGVGKTTMARLIAKAVNCLELKGGFEPCGACAACVEIEAGRSLDIIEIDAASQTGVDQVRENIIANAKVSAATRRYKVFIIDEVHMLSTAAFNALLKTLEEPPKNVIFILATTEIHKVPATIISRCQRFDFHKISLGVLVDRLAYICKNEGFEVSDEVLKAVAKHSQGYLRDALSLLGQVLSLGLKKISLADASLIIAPANFETVFKLTSLVAGRKVAEAVAYVNSLQESGADLFQFANDWIEFLRLVMLCKVSGSWVQLEEMVGSALSGAASTELASLTLADLLKLIELVLQRKNLIKTLEIPVLPLELVIVAFCS